MSYLCDHFQATKEEYSETSEGLSNLHTRIQRERRITCSTVWWLGMLGGYGEVCSATLDRVGVAIALGSRHGERAGGDKFVQQDALPILGNVAALGLANLQQIALDAGERNLFPRPAGVGDQLSLEIHEIKAKAQRSGDR